MLDFDISVAIFRERFELGFIINNGDFANFDDLVFMCQNDLVDSKPLDGLNTKFSVILDQIGHDLLLVRDFDQNTD